MTLTAPAPLVAEHETDGSYSGREGLDAWLGRRARKSQISGASRTYVVCEGVRVVAYYALASSAVAVDAAPGRFRRNMPDPIPVVVLGRLAVDERWRGKGLGRALVRDAGLRVAQAADVIGSWARGARDLGGGEAFLRGVGLRTVANRSDDPNDYARRSEGMPLSAGCVVHLR